MFAMLAQDAIFWLLSNQVKIAYDVQTAKGPVVSGEQMVDETFRSRGIFDLHDVRKRGSQRAPTTPPKASPLARRRLFSPQRSPLMGAWFRQSPLAYSAVLPIFFETEVVI
jgi:hypothetical protein